MYYWRTWATWPKNTSRQQGGYHKLRNFIKSKNKNYVEKKVNTLTAKEIEKFLVEAPDHKYLSTTVSDFFDKLEDS